MFLHGKWTPISLLRPSGRLQRQPLRRGFSAAFQSEIEWLAPLSDDIVTVYSSFRAIPGRPDLRDSVLAAIAQKAPKTAFAPPKSYELNLSLQRVLSKLKSIAETRLLNVYELSLVFELFFLAKFDFLGPIRSEMQESLFHKLRIKDSLKHIENEKSWTEDVNRTNQFLAACFFGMVTCRKEQPNFAHGLHAALADAFNTVPLTTFYLSRLYKTNNWFHVDSYMYEQANRVFFKAFPQRLKERLMAVETEPKQAEFDAIFALFYFSLLSKSTFELDWFAVCLNYFLWRKSSFSDAQARSIVDCALNWCDWKHMPHVRAPLHELLRALLSQLAKKATDSLAIFKLNYDSARLLSELLDIDALLQEFERLPSKDLTHIHFIPLLIIFLQKEHPARFTEFETRTGEKLTKLASEIEAKRTPFNHNLKKTLRMQKNTVSSRISNESSTEAKINPYAPHIDFLTQSIQNSGFKVHKEYRHAGYFWDFYLENFIGRMRESDLLSQNALKSLEILSADPNFKVFLEVDDRIHNDPFMRLETARYKFRSFLVSDMPVLVLKIKTIDARTIIVSSSPEQSFLRLISERTTAALRAKGLLDKGFV